MPVATDAPLLEGLEEAPKRESTNPLTDKLSEAIKRKDWEGANRIRVQLLELVNSWPRPTPEQIKENRRRAGMSS